jgi:membrane protein implicated in regulation of membrane protease activity
MKHAGMTFLYAFLGSLVTLWAGVTADALPDMRFFVQGIVSAIIAGLVAMMAYAQVWIETHNGASNG